jgi:hypothetical protein
VHRRAIFAALLLNLWPAAAHSEIIVSAARPVTRRVTVQLIQTALDDGTSPATVFGDTSQRTAIEAGIDTIWAQAGIDVAFLPDVVRYNDTFAYQGNPTTGNRPTGDLTTIRNNARDEGSILHPDSSVLDMFMVNIVPGFQLLSENSAAGLARITGNGIAAYSGDSLLTYQGGRDVIASVMAHEIGHNLGLNHTANGDANLMSPQGTTEQLTDSQINTVLTATSFAKLVPVVLAGDYDHDGVVDASDYTVWRNTLNQTGTALAADGNGNGRVDEGDYTVWKSNFGQRGGAGGLEFVSTATVPEPASLAQLLAACTTIMLLRRSAPRSSAPV